MRLFLISCNSIHGSDLCQLGDPQGQLPWRSRTFLPLISERILLAKSASDIMCMWLFHLIRFFLLTKAFRFTSRLIQSRRFTYFIFFVRFIFYHLLNTLMDLLILWWQGLNPEPCTCQASALHWTTARPNVTVWRFKHWGDKESCW